MLLTALPFMRPVKPTIEFIDVNSALSTSLSTMPTHQSGDILIAVAFHTGGTVPSLASGWTNRANASQSWNSFRIAYKIASSSSETSGTWTNAQNLLIAVYRNLDSTTPIGGVTVYSAFSGSNVTYPGIGAMQITDGTSWVAGVGFSESGSPTFVAPAGMVRRYTTTDRASLHDTDAGVTGWPSDVNGAMGVTASSLGITMELRAA